MSSPAPDSFTPEEQALLSRYFTNLDGPVFALINLPEVVKGALFARYSRSPKSLRRLFLDEFVGELDVSGDTDVYKRQPLPWGYASSSCRRSTCRARQWSRRCKSATACSC